MAIHYENYDRFSKGQGFIGCLCRPKSAQAKTKRWVAVDCHDCKHKLNNKRVISQDGEMGVITLIDKDGVWIEGITEPVSWKWLDEFWAPIPPLAEIFGEGTL